MCPVDLDTVENGEDRRQKEAASNFKHGEEIASGLVLFVKKFQCGDQVFLAALFKLRALTQHFGMALLFSIAFVFNC